MDAPGKSGGDDPVFRTILQQERNVALERLAEAKAQRDAEMIWIDE